MLTEDQRQFFEAFGFLVLRGVFTADEMATIKRESDEIFADGLGNKLPNGRVALQPFFERRPFMSQLAADDRIYSIGETLLGPDFFLIGTEGNAHAGDTYWHGAGRWDEKIKAVKIAFYPERLTAATGSLRVVPGSHRRGAPDPLEPLRHNSEDPEAMPFGVPQAEIPCVALELEPGDLGVFTEELLHAAFGGHDGRHQHAINFMENPPDAAKERDVRDLYESATYSLRPSRSYVDSDNPRIRRMVARNLELGFDVMEGV
jgi:ectoine hydroxylase-related dioxygenase (phytanoyl-CoA dioxygenase family)